MSVRGSAIVRFEIDVDEPELALAHFEGPDPGAVLALEAALTALFEETQAIVHVVTHSLKTSGKMHSEMTNGVWRGEITYGGVSAGSVHDPVWYARYEQNRGNGEHDFMLPVYNADARYEQAIIDYMRGAI